MSIQRLGYCIVSALFFVVCNGAFAANEKGVYFENLKNGATVHSPVEVKMGVTGMRVSPAGRFEEGVGHHHILIDSSFKKKGEVIPADDHNLHFGAGQTTAEVSLPPGRHTLTLQFADSLHRSYGKKWSKTIAINVE